MAGRSRDSGPKSPSIPDKRPGKAEAATPAPGAGLQPAEAGAPANIDGSALQTPRRIALDAAFRNRAELRQSITENLGQVRARNDRLDERVQQAFRNFNPTMRAAAAPARRNQVEPGVAPFETLSRVMTDRLDSLKATAAEPRIAIRATSSLIQWDGGDDAGVRSGTIELGTLIDFIDARGVAPLTFATSSAVAACQAAQRAQAILDELDTGTRTAEAGSDGDIPAVSTSNGADRDRDKVADFVERTVHEQMRPATAPEARLEYGLIPNGADSNEAQARLMKTFQLRPGPTDVTAYHDFSTLQIAFEDVWTHIFDGELEALGRQLYREYVGLKDFLDYDPDTADRPISSLDDLTWLIGEIRFLSQIAQDGLPTGAVDAVGTTNIPKGTNDIAKEAENFVESLPGGRVGTAVATLGISELVLWVINEAGNFGKKTALRWDDLVNDRTLQRGDRILGTVANAVIQPGNVELVLKTDISNRKEVAFQILDQSSQRFQNFVKVANAAGPGVRILTDSNGRPEFYEHAALIPSSLLTIGVLEFASQEGGLVLGRYVLGDLDKIVPDGGRLTLYWKDR